jgi:hypothetical protein
MEDFSFKEELLLSCSKIEILGEIKDRGAYKSVNIKYNKRNYKILKWKHFY